MNNPIVDLQQGTDEWLAFRRKHVMASDAPAIMQVSKWTTPYQLFLDKTGLGAPKPVSESMRRGLEIESVARSEVEVMLGSVDLSPAVLQHKGIDWLGASLDGYNHDQKLIVEIKLANAEDHECARNGKVPAHYWPQLSHQMIVADVKEMYYYSYRGNDDSILLVVKRNEDYSNQLIEAENRFWEQLKNCEAPELTERDYERRTDPEWEANALGVLRAQQEIKTWEQQLEYCKKNLEKLADGKSCIGYGIRLSRTTRKGAVQYSSIPELDNVDLNKYRGVPTTYYRIMKE